MPNRADLASFGKTGQSAVGLAVCIIFWVTGEWLREGIGLPLPGGVIGFFVLYCALCAKPGLARYISQGCNLLVTNLILFFVPAVLSIIAFPEFFGLLGVQLLIALTVGTAIMMATVGWFAQWLSRLS